MVEEIEIDKEWFSKIELPSWQCLLSTTRVSDCYIVQDPLWEAGMQNEMRSIRAIKECMHDLGHSESDGPSRRVGATIMNIMNSAGGSITVTFNSTWHSPDGPIVELDEVAMGYCIRYINFRPRWQDFVYDKEQKELTVSGDDYKFSLTFKEQHLR